MDTRYQNNHCKQLSGVVSADAFRAHLLLSPGAPTRNSPLNSTPRPSSNPAYGASSRKERFCPWFLVLSPDESAVSDASTAELAGQFPASSRYEFQKNRRHAPRRKEKENQPTKGKRDALCPRFEQDGLVVGHIETPKPWFDLSPQTTARRALVNRNGTDATQ